MSTATPYASAVCYYGSAGGASCSGPSGSYRWGYLINGVWHDYDTTFSPHWGFQYRNCTDYVAFWEFFQNFSTHPFTGDASAWKNEANDNNGWKVSTTGPHLGDIAWWGSDHVAVVTTLLAHGKVAVEEYNGTLNGTDGVRVNIAADSYLQRYP